jgi:hypothetical protein
MGVAFRFLSCWRGSLGVASVPTPVPASGGPRAGPIGTLLANRPCERSINTTLLDKGGEILPRIRLPKARHRSVRKLSEIAPAVALSLCACAMAAPGEEPLPLEITTAALAPPIQALTFPGRTRGWYDSAIYARVSGYVADWFVDIGDLVKKGQLLATIEAPDLDSRLASARAECL